MDHLTLTLRDKNDRFRPGERVEGRVEWALDKAPKSIEVRLVWFTRGRGNTDTSVLASQILPLGSAMPPSQSPFAPPTPIVNPARNSSPFSFALPPAPHSFSGTLISLVWAVEAVVLPGKLTARAEFTLSPTGQEILLPRVDSPDNTVTR